MNRLRTALTLVGWTTLTAACGSPSEPGSAGDNAGAGQRAGSSQGSAANPGTSSGGSVGAATSGGAPNTSAGNSGNGSGSNGVPTSGGSASGGFTNGSAAAASTGGSAGVGAKSGGLGGASEGTGGFASGTGGAASGNGGRTTGGFSNGGATTGGRGGSSGGGSVATSGGRGGSGSVTGGASGTGGSGGAGTTTTKFSFFVTSLGELRRLSGSQDGFGGDLRYGEATGLAGADKICKTIAEKALPGAGQKEWRAFLSTTTVNAADRVGSGPWYDRLGRLVAATKSDLLQTRPKGAETTIIDDLPNENGIPNHSDGVPGCTGDNCPDNHDTLTASKADGTWDGGGTCNDWTSTTASGQPRVGHSWKASSGQSWIQAHTAGGCAAGVNLVQSGGAKGVPTVGAGGGYGGFYCLALTP